MIKGYVFMIFGGENAGEKNIVWADDFVEADEMLENKLHHHMFTLIGDIPYSPIIQSALSSVDDDESAE